MSQSIEVVRFRVPPEARERFVSERKTADAALHALGGFVGSELAQGDGDSWLLIVRWASREAVLAAQKHTMSSPGVAAVNAWIALASEVVSFETLDVRSPSGS